MTRCIGGDKAKLGRNEIFLHNFSTIEVRNTCQPLFYYFIWQILFFRFAKSEPQTSLFDYEYDSGARFPGSVVSNHIYQLPTAAPEVIEVQRTANIIPLQEIRFETSDQHLSLFDNEPIALINTNVDQVVSARPRIPTAKNANYGQFSTLRKTNEEQDVYRLHGQNEDGKNTQIIINLSNEPKSYLGLDRNRDNQDLFRQAFIGPPAPPPQTVGPPAPPTVASTTPTPVHGHGGYGSTPPPIYYGKVMQNQPPAEPPIQQNPVPSPQAPPSYGVPQAPPSYNPPAQDPVPSYGVPQAPPVQDPAPSYGVPQAPPVQDPAPSYGPPPVQDPAPSYGVPQAPPQDEIIQTQFVMPALTLSWQQPTITQRSPPAAPPPKPSYDYDSPNDPQVLSDFNSVSGDVHYHVHVQELQDFEQLDQQLSAPPRAPPSNRPRAPRRRPPQRNPQRPRGYGQQSPPRQPQQRPLLSPGFPDTSNLSEWVKLKCFIWCFFNQAEFQRNEAIKK